MCVLCLAHRRIITFVFFFLISFSSSQPSVSCCPLVYNYPPPSYILQQWNGDSGHFSQHKYILQIRNSHSVLSTMSPPWLMSIKTFKIRNILSCFFSILSFSLPLPFSILKQFSSLPGLLNFSSFVCLWGLWFSGSFPAFWVQKSSLISPPRVTCQSLQTSQCPQDLAPTPLKPHCLLFWYCSFLTNQRRRMHCTPPLLGNMTLS